MLIDGRLLTSVDQLPDAKLIDRGVSTQRKEFEPLTFMRKDLLTHYNRATIGKDF